MGEECGSHVSSRLWGGALRDETQRLRGRLPKGEDLGTYLVIILERINLI